MIDKTKMFFSAECRINIATCAKKNVLIVLCCRSIVRYKNNSYWGSLAIACAF